ncbi:Coenzyme A disulfide reductase [Clostridium ljungdahlii DSM 13528]|uniref:Coenzyme A disulfide reductase n=1 Tax=Clostridium ljungdahlii (strain ATCC 55383 / DSM 13528 / PETC) TaxID=748727 RepID=D8GPB9_CLOLD|nr:CoA-disulfide reductase [Clostridium ljungdahlii]ADK15997.1 predicted FAD-dependent pyridine nucleotide-disulfide oxidoreductase (class I) [Clostridium ljungdahlii DSM 13528]OAA87128.1 Coenzyme A disulfide reductase [Clostridium ljungdahlii DSM 13528]
MKKIVIVGGVAGGASAAARLRRLDENAEIILFEKGEYISFANCGLPYYIGETIKEREKLLVQTPEAMKASFNIDIRVNSEVITVDTKSKKVRVSSKDKGEYEENYDYLILSPGATPIKPPIPGIQSDKIFTLRNVPDTDKIKAYVDKENVKNAIVIGGGYIGVEMAENLKERALNTALVEAAPHILAPFDSEMVTFAEKELEDNGVGIVLNDGVKEFKEDGTGVNVILNSGKILYADMIILAIGVKPDTAFLKDSGIEFGTKGHIIVNNKMETKVEGVYAVGDAIEVVDFVNESKTAIALAGPANKQGRIAADNICGLNSIYKGTMGTAIIKVFGLTGSSTGNNERTLKSKNIQYKAIYLHPNSSAGYYPGAAPMTIKLIFNDEGKILGAQAFGYAGVDKRIDDIAITMRLGGTVYDLTELELAYAPPYSSAKDPVNMAGFIAENVLTGKDEIILTEDIDNRDKDKTQLVDVRTELECSNGIIEGAINIPSEDIRARMNELDKSKEILIYCQVGLRGYIVARILRSNGFKVKNLTGGYKTYTMGKFKPRDVVMNNSGEGGSMDLRGKKSNVSLESNLNEYKEADEAYKKGDFDKNLDACGICCPGPLMRVNSNIQDMKEGEVLKVTASDQGFYEDIKSWCERTNNELLDRKKEKGNIIAFIKKGNKKQAVSNSNSVNNGTIAQKDNKTLVVFSGDLDKALASFIIANGAAAMGKKVTMFFTFWGLNILRKHEKVSVSKGFMDKMFGFMMPRGAKRLKLSKMNMLGMGTKMMKMVMRNKNVSSLDELIKAAIDSGIEIVACQMSMDVMGLKQEELIDGVKVGGVGYYLGEAEDSNVNLFI